MTASPPSGGEGPREKLLRHGAGRLTDDELLAILLRTGTRQRPVLSLAQQLLAEHGGIRGLLLAQRQDLLACAGVGPAKYCQLMAVLEMAIRFSEAQVERTPLSNPAATRQWLRARLGHRRQEVFGVLFLDTRNRLIEFEEMFTGTIDGAAAPPREIVRRALEQDASGLIVCHNHPSGVAEPSGQDQAYTRRLRDALALVDIRLLDHFVIGHRDVYSMAEHGLL